MPVILPVSVAGGAATALERVPWGPGAGFAFGGTSPSVSSTVMNAGGIKAASVGVVRETGNITHVGVYASAKAGTSPTYRVSIQTLDGSGNPSGSMYGGCVAGTFTVASAGFQWVALSTPASGTLGDVVAAVVEYDSGTIDGSNNITLRNSGSVVGNAGLPYVQTYNGTAWTKLTQLPMIPVRYADNKLSHGIAAATSSWVSSGFSTSASPDEQGALFQVPFACKCVGARVFADPSAASGDGSTIKLYDASGTLMGSKAIGALEYGSAGFSNHDVFWTQGAQPLVANTNYRVTDLSTTATSRALGEIVVPDTLSKNAFPEGPRWQKTTRNAGGAWTDTPNTIPLIALLLSEITA